MKLAIHQPNFMPWIGFFHKVAHSDIFVLLDDVQFERGKSYTSRTEILIGGRRNWLTVPIVGRSDLNLIKDVGFDTSFDWKKKHLRTLELNYGRSKHFQTVFPVLADAYQNASNLLIDINIPLVLMFAKKMELKTTFTRSSLMNINQEILGWQKLLAIITSVNAETYLSGSGAGSKKYVNVLDLSRIGKNTEWQEYKSLSYAQFNTKEFVANLSIIDAFFNLGFEGTRNLLFMNRKENLL